MSERYHFEYGRFEEFGIDGAMWVVVDRFENIDERERYYRIKNRDRGDKKTLSERRLGMKIRQGDKE